MKFSKDAFRKMRIEVLKKVNNAETASAKSGLQIAMQQSSGPLSSKDLVRMDHPDARRHGSQGWPFDTGRINTQSGVLSRSWRLKSVPNGAAPVIENIASYAKYLDVSNPDNAGGGTSKMFGIPIQDAILIRLLSIREANVRALNGEIKL